MYRIKGVVMKENQYILPIRILRYIFGLIFMAFGVAFSVNSDLGVSPVNSLPYVNSRILKTDMGSCITGVFTCYILVQIALLRKQFKLIDMFQLVLSGLFGCFANAAKSVLGDAMLFGTSYIGRLGMLAISIVLIAVGLVMYLDVGLINMPVEGMTAAITNMQHDWSFHRVKIFVDCSAVGLAALLSVLFLGELRGIREGTLLAAVFVGKLVPPMRAALAKLEQSCSTKKELEV